MGNCLPKLKRKNKVSPQPRVKGQKRRQTTVFDILSRSSASVSIGGLHSEEVIEIAKALVVSDMGSPSVESLAMMKSGNIIDELKDQDPRKPVFFQVDFVQGMPHRMPSRLAERMGPNMDILKSAQQTSLTEDDEMLMDEILEDTEAIEKMEKMEEQQIIARKLREGYLNAIRDKARGMTSRPPTRVDGCEGRGLEGRG